MGDERDTERGAAAARGSASGQAARAGLGDDKAPKGPSLDRSAELDIKALWGDLDDPESAETDWGKRASAALKEPSKPSASAPRATLEPARVAAESPLFNSELDDLEQLGTGALPSSPLGSLPPEALPRARAIPVRGQVTPAPPMPVPALRPPSAAPPPLRASSVPPAHFGYPDGDEEPTLGLGNTLGHDLGPAAWRANPATLQNWPPTAHLDRIRSLPPLPDAPYSPGPELGASGADHRPYATGTEATARSVVAVQLGTAAQPDVTTKTGASVNLLQPAGGAAVPAPLPARLGSALQRWWWLGLLGLVAVCGVLLLVLRTPPAGALVVNAAGPDSRALPHLRVYVDAQLRCSFSPCRVNGLSTGPHEVRAEAPNYTSPELARVSLEPGTDTSLTVNLVPVVVKGGLSISAKGSDLSVWLDGKRLGLAPQAVNDIEPGTHVVRVTGPRFVDFEEQITLNPGQQLALGPFKPRVKLGQLTLRAGSDAAGAAISVDGNRIAALPAELDLAGDATHSVVAEKSGFDRFETSLTFQDGKAEAQLEIALLPSSGAAAAPGDGSETSSKSNQATLHLNSIPPSSVLLDGKPLGRTPRLGVLTSAGVHSVVFIHPSRGKKTVTVRVAAGQSKTVSARF